MRVRVETGGEAYTGTLTPGRNLSEVLDDGRAYLALWDATVEGTSRSEDFVAIHKAAIRSIVVIAERTRKAAPLAVS